MRLGQESSGLLLLYVPFKQKGLGKGAASRTNAMVKPRPCKFEGAQMQAKRGGNWPLQRVGEGAAPQTRESKTASEK